MKKENPHALNRLLTAKMILIEIQNDVLFRQHLEAIEEIEEVLKILKNNLVITPDDRD